MTIWIIFLPLLIFSIPGLRSNRILLWWWNENSMSVCVNVLFFTLWLLTVWNNIYSRCSAKIFSHRWFHFLSVCSMLYNFKYHKIIHPNFSHLISDTYLWTQNINLSGTNFQLIYSILSSVKVSFTIFWINLSRIKNLVVK